MFMKKSMLYFIFHYLINKSIYRAVDSLVRHFQLCYSPLFPYWLVIFMIHEISYAIKKHDFEGFLYPCYEENCISNIPGSILNLFGIETNLSKLPMVRNEFEGQKVVLLILDGFGYNQFLRHQKANKFLINVS